MTHHLFAGFETGDDDLDHYLNRITAEHNQSPRFVQTVALSVKPIVDALKIVRRLPTIFDIDEAVGQQLDWVGKWIGLTRRVTVRNDVDFFSLDIPNLGLDQAEWYGSDAERDYTVTLEDDEYRLILQTRILVNYWDGTRDGLYNVLSNYFVSHLGYDLLLDDNYEHGMGWFTFDDPNPAMGWESGFWDLTDPTTIHHCKGNMWMTIILYGGEFPSLVLALLTGGYFDVRPAGVGIDYYRNDTEAGLRWDTEEFEWDRQGVWDQEPMFGWDDGPTREQAESGETLEFSHPPLAGWDIAPWALKIKPSPHLITVASDR